MISHAQFLSALQKWPGKHSSCRAFLIKNIHPPTNLSQIYKFNQPELPSRFEFHSQEHTPSLSPTGTRDLSLCPIIINLIIRLFSG